jgi:hypothetical protein
MTVGRIMAVINTTNPAFAQLRGFNGRASDIFCLVMSIYNGKAGKININCETNMFAYTFAPKKPANGGACRKTTDRSRMLDAIRPIYSRIPLNFDIHTIPFQIK